MLFAFDDTLIGHREVVEMNTADLTIPLFVFPKGSFFADNTYAKVKGTNTILRPGLDYVVLSCNETIPFSTNPEQDLKLRQAYVRNVILLRTTTPMVLEWVVAYCGGEDATKSAEYDNYINSLYNQARTKGTTNLFTTIHQGWGNYLSLDNTQIMAGKHIYSKPLRVAEENEIGGGLGWGKVELAVEAIAESVTHGGDAAVIDAFFNWVKHHEIEFNKRKDVVSGGLDNSIQNLAGKRVGVDQFIFKEDSKLPNSLHFVEHNNVMLRGLDPNQASGIQANPTHTNRADIGYYGLAEAGFDVNTLGVKLFQRTDAATSKVRHGVVFEKAIYNAGTITYRLLKDVGVLTGTQTLYIVSKKLGIIHTRDVTSMLLNPAAVSTALSFAYATTQVDFTTDTITAYILNGNLQGDFSWVGNAVVVINNVRYAFELEVINRGNLLGADVTEVIDNVTPQFEMVVKRSYNINATNIILRAKIAETGAVVTLNGVASITVNFAAGESEKRILVNLTNSTQLKDKQMILFYLGANTTTILTSVLVGLKSVGRQDYAQISLLDNTNRVVNAIDVNNTYTLKVQFSKDADYFISALSLALTKLIGTSATALLGEKILVSNSVVTYPIKFSGSLDSVVALALTDVNNIAFKTNTLNVAYGTNSLDPDSPIFSPIVNGKHLRVVREATQYILDFAIAVKDHTLGGYVFTLTSDNLNLQLPANVISNHGLVRFRATIPISKLTSGTMQLMFSRNAQNYPLDFTINVDKLMVVEIEYRDGSFSDKVLETKRAFRIMLTNPFSDRKLLITRDSFAPALGINDISYAGGLTEIIVPTLSLNEGERKQLTVGDWVGIDSIKSSSVGYTRYAPNCTVTQSLTSNGSVVKAGSYLNEVGEVLINKEDYLTQAINVLTGKADFNHEVTENYIDVVTQFNNSISNITKALVTVTVGYTATIRNTIISPIDKTIIVALAVKRNDNNLVAVNSLYISIDYLDVNSQVVHSASTSVIGV